MPDLQPRADGRGAVRASAAGAGGGTLLVLYANSLPEGSRLRFWLSLASPSVSVLLGVMWLVVRVEIANYVQWIKVRSLATSAKATLQEALANPSTSDKHKRVIRARLEEVELLLTEHQMRRIRSASPVSGRDVRSVEESVRTDQEH